MSSPSADVVIIGAGPSGAVAAAQLIRRGRSVLVLERETFPRFSIGESLLPQSMGLLEEAGLLRPVVEAGFQHKNGARFVRGALRSEFDFRDKFTAGWGTTYQVQRGTFDKTLADAAAAMGADVRYRHEILAAQPDSEGVTLTVRNAEHAERTFECRGKFLLDASGFGRVLPRLLQLEKPSRFPLRRAIFTHVVDHIAPSSGFDRNKILITTHPEHVDVWYWLIPFSNGVCSVGVVAAQTFFDRYGTEDLTQVLRTLHDEDPNLRQTLARAEWNIPARTLGGYAADVSSLHGPGFALLGNAGEFLDPVFSSGVTIALKSASLVAPLVHRHLEGEAVDWPVEFDQALRRGVDCFRSFVESWYRGGFQDVIFYPQQQPSVRQMICSILAGYAWDTANPYVAEPRRLQALETLCAR